MNLPWPAVPLGELLKPVSRAEKVDPEKVYNLLGARWYAKGLYIKATKYGSEINAQNLYLIKEGDFVYNRLFGWKGSFALASEVDHGCYVSNEFPCFIVDRNRLDPKYLWRYFSQETVWEEALGLSSGGTPTSRNRLKEKKLLSMLLPLPPLPEQRRIMAKIEALADQLAEAQSLRHKAAEEADALVTSMHVNLAGKRARELREVVVLDEDAVSVKLDEEYPQVGIKSFGAGLFTKPPTKGTDTTYKTFNRLYPGALVLSQVKGWEGAIAVAGDDLAGWFVSPEYRTFRCIVTEASPDYLAALVRTQWFWTRLQTATRGVGARRERTRPEQFLKIKMPMPDLNQQKSALAVFKRLDALKKLQAQTAAELEALLPAILDRAFKGEL